MSHHSQLDRPTATSSEERIATRHRNKKLLYVNRGGVTRQCPTCQAFAVEFLGELTDGKEVHWCKECGSVMLLTAEQKQIWRSPQRCSATH